MFFSMDSPVSCRDVITVHVQDSASFAVWFEVLQLDLLI